jgi:NodT family efflux transporter outer membrane factor (OMF) lipoprotein
MSSRPLLAAGVVVLLGGCAVGPDYKPPAPPSMQAYDSVEPGATGAPARATLPADADDLAGQWWQLFKSPALDATLRLSIADSPTLAAARATLDAAREAIIVARAGFLPRIGLTAGTERESSEPATWNGGLTASYTFNAFGGATLRLVEQQKALAEFERDELAASYLTLTGNVVTEAMTIALSRLEITTTLDLIASDQKNLDLVQREFEAGAAARTDVLTAESQLAADQATLPSLRQQLSAARHALAILVGRAPAQWSAPEFDVTEFTPPAAIPLTLPSALVRRRPDILASEAQLRAASAAIGIAVSQEYPSITLSGGLSREALTAAGLFHDFERVWSAAGGLTQPLFQGGALRAQTRAARDLYVAQAASYQQVVLTAFGQVADDLRALEHDADRVTAYHRSLKVAAASLELQRVSYAAGKTTALQLIDAERTYAQARLGNASAEFTQLQDSVQLFVALGGGWWHDAAVPAR